MTESDNMKAKLMKLVKFICDDLHITMDKFYNPYSRDLSAKARHVFVLVATDAEFPYPIVASVLQRDPSFITQTRRRKYGLRKEIEFLHAKAYLEQLTPKETINAYTG